MIVEKYGSKNAGICTNVQAKIIETYCKWDQTEYTDDKEQT